ncbi:Hypothetical predicted protein [Mytilus galloprovincialis]|uniref:Uncharacterized protein n=1 Tax=Mytilus galloprovincialis TaxID=29158 RepID=A0A8B6CNY7_MYTGA|nr:Hypothetical predicted protein [Mytilus galloprovincialis]
MLSPLSRGFGTWTGNYDPYNEDGAESDTSFCSLPGIEEPHRHGITVGFVSRTPSATLISPPYGRTSSHAREATLSASTHYAREATLSGKRNGPGREVLFADPMSRENSDSQMNLPKTFLTRKGALMLFAADEGELDSLTSRTDVQPRVMRIRKPVDVIDTSLKLGTMDKLAMSVLQFGEEEIPKENSNVTDEKNKMFMKFLNKVDDRDVDKRAQPGGDVKYYLSDLKHKTSLQMGLSGDTALPRSREALELRAILLGLQGDGSWPMTYRQTGADFKRPSNLAEQFSRPASHLHHPQRNQSQRILSSDKLEDSVQSLRSYLGRSLDNNNGVPLLTRRHFRRHRSQRPHTNTPTRDQDIHGDDEESRDKLGEIIDPRLPRDDRGRIEMIEIPHPTTPRSTDIATEDKVSPRPRSESSSKLGEKIEEDVDPETLVSIVEDKFAQKKAELPTMPTIPDYLKPKTQSKQQSKPQAKKDQKKKGQITKVKKEEKTTKTPADVSKAIDITSVQPEEQDEITQIIKKKVTLPPENEHSVMPDFVTEALNRSKERSRLQLEEEFAEKQRMIEKEIGNTLYEGEGMTVEELELEKKELKKREELAKEKLLKGKPQKKMDEKSKKSGGSSSVRSKKSKGGKDPLQMEKERIRALKEQEKLSNSPQRMEEIRALEEKIAAQSNSMSADDKKFKDKLQEVQMELERIEREAYMAEQTEADVRQALREERMKRMEEKAKLKKEELARKRQQLIDRKQQEKQLKEEARQRELQKIMMLMDDEERKKRQEEERLKKEEDEKEEEKKRKEMEEEFARQEREEEDRRRALEEEIEQEELRRIQVEQDEIRKQQEVVQAQKEALLEEQRRKRELAALEEQRQVEELDRKQQEELKRQAEERARINELLQLEEEVRERMKQDTEKRREEAIQRRDTNIDAKSNLNKIRHSQGINRAFVYSYFINWPIESYMRPIGEQEKKKKEAKLREKRKKAR